MFAENTKTDLVVKGLNWEFPKYNFSYFSFQTTWFKGCVNNSSNNPSLSFSTLELCLPYCFLNSSMFSKYSHLWTACLLTTYNWWLTWQTLAYTLALSALQLLLICLFSCQHLSRLLTWKSLLQELPSGATAGSKAAPTMGARHLRYVVIRPGTS